MPKPTPPAFAPAALTFLRELAGNNRREWFQPRKAEFEAVLRQPMLALTAAVVDRMRTFAVGHVRPAGRAVQRVYRDVRFSKDKSPYKTNVAALFPGAGSGKTASPMFYFSLTGDGVDVAAGLYLPGPVELRAVRADLAADPAAFVKRTTAKRLVDALGPLQGERLARVPKGYPPDHPAADLLRLKQFYYGTQLPPSAATRPGLLEAIVDRFRAAAPFVRHLNDLVVAAERSDAGDGRPVRPEPMF